MLILLIHGSMMTAESEWGDIIPALAELHFILAPDCRGHGNSSNPNNSYSFSEMAGDLALLVRVLGFEKAQRCERHACLRRNGQKPTILPGGRR